MPRIPHSFLILISVLLAACSTRGGSPSTSAALQSTPTQSPTPAASQIPSEKTPTPASAPAYDCSKVEHLLPDSPEAQKIVEQFIADYRLEYPTEYMAFDQLWSVDRLGDTILVLGRITSEQRDALLIRMEGGKYHLLEQFTSTGQPLVSRYILPEFFAERVPKGPQELYYCMDVSPFVEVPPSGEFTFDPQADCSRVESIPADGEEGQSIAGAIQEFYQTSGDEPVDIVSIQHQGEYYAVQASYKVNRKPGPPDFFILNRSGGNVEVAFYIGGAGAYLRSMFIRNLYAQVPYLPPELLNCLELHRMFNLPTPTPD